MAFPTTGVLENFAGAQAAPPNANWTRIGGLTVDLRCTGGGLAQSDSTGTGGDYWNPATFGPACEAYVTVPTLGADAETIQLHLRMTNPGSATLRDGYLLRVRFKAASADEWDFFRVDDNVLTLIGALTTQNVAAGDKIGFEIVGSTLRAHHFNGTSWAQVMSTTDATYSAAGNVGLAIQAQTWRLDNFAGGTVVGLPVNTVAPAVTGTPTQGEQLSCTQGTWNPAGDSYAYQWQRDTGGGFANIGGATASTHTLVAADVGADVRCVVTATNGAGPTAANSNTVQDIGQLYEGSIPAFGYEMLPMPISGSVFTEGPVTGQSAPRISIGIGIGL